MKQHKGGSGWTKPVKIPCRKQETHILAYLLSSFFNCQHIKNMQFNSHAEDFWLQHCCTQQSIDSLRQISCLFARQYIVNKSSKRKQWLGYLMACLDMPLHTKPVVPSNPHWGGHPDWVGDTVGDRTLKTNCFPYTCGAPQQKRACSA